MTRRYPPHAWERPGFGSLRPFPRRVDWHRMRAVLRNARSKERRFNVMRPFWDYREGMAAVRRLKLLDVYRASP